MSQVQNDGKVSAIAPSDEINIADLLSNVYRQRGLIVGVMLIALLCRACFSCIQSFVFCS